jgi:hypothetical protein
MIAQRRMKPFVIIHLLDEVGDPFFDICQGFVVPKVDLFGLKSLEKAFHHGIVERIASS